ncbi:MAG: hypothetical protein LBC19_12020 [Tannerella sp.]|nr:hypothetical protein [Tannerella sp.]
MNRGLHTLLHVLTPEERKEFLRRHPFGYGRSFGHGFFAHEESKKKDGEKA